LIGVHGNKNQMMRACVRDRERETQMCGWLDGTFIWNIVCQPLACRLLPVRKF